MCPPSPACSRLAWITMAIAFQRMMERMRHSMAGSPGERCSLETGMVLR